MYLYKTIPIKNVFYMLSYISNLRFDATIQGDFTKSDKTLFELYIDLFCNELKQLVQSGLYKDYINYDDVIYTVRGHIEMSETARLKSQGSNAVACNFDEFITDSSFNSIVKSVIELLLFRSGKLVTLNQKKKLHLWGCYFGDISSLSLQAVDWSSIVYNRQNIRYRMILFLCQLIVECLLFSTDKDEFDLPFINQVLLYNIFEKFVYQYCKAYCKSTYNNVYISHEPMNWCSENLGPLMPRMQPDILIYSDDKALIIDTKFYEQILVSRNSTSKKTYRSSHLYQIFTYIMHYSYNNPHLDTSGLLLYAGTEMESQSEYRLQTHKVCNKSLDVEILDLSVDIPKIKEQLNLMIQRYFS